MEAVEGRGTLDGDTLAIINDQYDALEYVTEMAQDDKELTVQFIRELHQIITRHQATYEAIDSLGRSSHPALNHGVWKQGLNYLVRPDGTRLECTPPERVQDQIETLVRYFNEARTTHPLVRAAWLHHSFACIHPFEDGNGRVGRALVLLDVLRAHFAPLVVGRDDREQYLSAMDRANEGDLDALIIEFAELERRAMVRQFQAPLTAFEGLGVLEVAKASSIKLADFQGAARRERAKDFAKLADRLAERMQGKLGGLGRELAAIFKKNDPRASAWTTNGDPGTPQAGHWHGQLVKLAKRHDFYANLAEGSWWVTLNLKLLDEQMRFLIAIVRVGAGDTGIGAVIVQAERLFQEEGTEDGPRAYEWLFQPESRDQVPFTYEGNIDDVWLDVEQLLDRALAATVAEFTRNLA